MTQLGPFVGRSNDESRTGRRSRLNRPWPFDWICVSIGVRSGCRSGEENCERQGASPMALELSIRVKKLVAKLAKSFGIHTRHTESLGDFRYNSRAIGG